MKNRHKITVAMFELAGRFVPLVTPFTDDGASLSEVRLAKLLRFYVNQGAEGFALATDSGEFSTLSLAERKSLMELVHRETQNAKQTIINVSTTSTSFSLDLAQHAARHGARAVILMPPYFGVHSQAEHVQHIHMVSKHSKLPIVVVDPQHVLQEDATGAISHLPNVHLAWPHSGLPETHTDWFQCYGLHVDPMAGIDGSVAGDFVLRNRAAVAKTLLMDFDLEVGPPRMPTLPIPYREIRKAA